MRGKTGLIILSLIAPILLVPIEYLLPYPAVVEELVILGIISWWLKTVKIKNSDWIYAALAGIIFAVSESILYLNRIIILGKWWVFPERLALTIFLHSATMIIIFFGVKRGKIFVWLSLLAAILIHWTFNLLVTVL